MGRRHAEFLVPLLDDRGLRATFFVHAAPTADWLSGGKVWQEVAAAGHEIRQSDEPQSVLVCPI